MSRLVLALAPPFIYTRQPIRPQRQSAGSIGGGLGKGLGVSRRRSGRSRDMVLGPEHQGVRGAGVCVSAQAHAHEKAPPALSCQPVKQGRGSSRWRGRGGIRWPYGSYLLHFPLSLP